MIRVIGNNLSLWKYLFKDVGGVCVYPYESKETLSKVFYKIRDVFNIFQTADKLWCAYYIYRNKINKNDDVWILNCSTIAMSPCFLKYLKGNCRQLNLLVLDSLGSMNDKSVAKIIKRESMFDTVYTFDKVDVVKHNWVCSFAYYSYIKPIRPQNNAFSGNSIDVFFAGFNKGRLNKLVALYDSITNQGLKCFFIITGVKEEEALKYKREGITFNTSYKYDELIWFITQSKAILEVVQAGQTGISLRAVESVIYNKILLTNSKGIFDFPFYNSSYMLSLEKLELSSLPLILQSTTPSYSCGDFFSPIHLGEKS